ncbi:hypothetical protein ACGFNP_33690 [Nonomuraea sp. NPDC049269]|uniref:hypothetical protein n=1 Tax=Nonomuraea sp. NPDC049269 TaxID=3364349 RepID=UPI0037223AA6
MNLEAVDRLRAEASREDYASMARLARVLYETGLGPREVLRECYGVMFPEELFVVVDAGLWSLDLLAYFTNQPWELAVPPDRGGPAETPDAMADTESLILARDPDLVPLLQIPAARAGGNDRIVCYRLKELRAGRPTVFCLGAEPYPSVEVCGGEAVRCGESMLAVLYEEHVTDLRSLEEELHSTWNRGAGSVSGDEAKQARASLEMVVELQRQADGTRASAPRASIGAVT